MIDLSIIIVSFNTKKLTLDCIKSVVEKTKDIDYEMIVVDNGSSDGTMEKLKESKILKLKTIVNKKNLGFAAANNQGTKAAKGRYILYLNSDTLISDNVLGEMVAWMDKNKKVGVASSALVNKDGSFQPTGGSFPTLLRVFSWMTIQDLPFVDSVIKPFHPFHKKSFFSKGQSFYKEKREIDWVTGAFLFARREVVEAVGGWDNNYFMYVEEVDLCYRIKKADWQIWYLPRWEIIHLGGQSSKSSEFPVLLEFEGLKKFYKKFLPSWQYPILRLLLKIGALGRIILFGILEGKEGVRIYAKAFGEV